MVNFINFVKDVFIKLEPFIYPFLLFLVSCLSISSNSSKKLKKVLKLLLKEDNKSNMYKSQCFDKMEVQYKYDKVNDCLVELPDKIDIQALVNSSRETSLDVLLDKFYPDMVVDDTKVAEYTANKDIIDDMLDMQQFKYHLIDKYGFPEDISIEKAIDLLKNNAERLKAKLNDKELLKTQVNEKIKEAKKEVIIDEKKNVVQEEQKSI